MADDVGRAVAALVAAGWTVVRWTGPLVELELGGGGRRVLRDGAEWERAAGAAAWSRVE